MAIDEFLRNSPVNTGCGHGFGHGNGCGADTGYNCFFDSGSGKCVEWINGVGYGSGFGDGCGSVCCSGFGYGTARGYIE